MKTIKYLTTIALLLLLLAAGCDKDKEETEEIIEGKWKLAGIIDTETGELLREPEPKDCEECYTLTFDTKYTATIHTINKNYGVRMPFLTSYKAKVASADDPILDFCEIYEKDGQKYCESQDFYLGILWAESYAMISNALIFYTIDIRKNKISLLFKPFKIKKQ